ncbi:MAG: phosphate acyltransferase, partial [Sphingomicrobium sp.]
MMGAPRIAIDAMGGDSGPAAMIAGAARAIKRDPELQFAVYGDERLIAAELDRHA